MTKNEKQHATIKINTGKRPISPSDFGQKSETTGHFTSTLPETPKEPSDDSGTQPTDKPSSGTSTGSNKD